MLACAQAPISLDGILAVGEISKSKISKGTPSVVQAFGTYNRQTEPRAPGETYIDDGCYMTLDRGTTKKEICLVVAVTKSFQILYCIQTGLSICNCCIHEILLAILIDAEALEVDVSTWTKFWFYWPWDENWELAHSLHSFFDQTEFKGDCSCYFNRSTEGYLTISLCGRELASIEHQEV